MSCLPPLTTSLLSTPWMTSCMHISIADIISVAVVVLSCVQWSFVNVTAKY